MFQIHWGSYYSSTLKDFPFSYFNTEVLEKKGNNVTSSYNIPKLVPIDWVLFHSNSLLFSQIDIKQDSNACLQVAKLTINLIAWFNVINFLQ